MPQNSFAERNDIFPDLLGEVRISLAPSDLGLPSFLLLSVVTCSSVCLFSRAFEIF